jgi:hypothetical protein
MGRESIVKFRVFGALALLWLLEQLMRRASDCLKIDSDLYRITDARSFVEALFMAGSSLSKDECNAIQIVATRALDSIDAARAHLKGEVRSWQSFLSSSFLSLQGEAKTAFL